jgi:acyl-CoA thioesterase I
MAMRAKVWRIVLLTGLSLAVVISSIVIPESGVASSREGPEPGRRPLASLSRLPLTGETQCLVTPGSSPGRPRPLLVALGASFTAGVGAERPSQGWAIRLAELIRWRAVTIGVPGAGYVAEGTGRLGPVAREVIRAHLAALHPALVLIQAGHDDLGIPTVTEAARVASLVESLRAEVPSAKLAFLTVFSPPDAAGPLLRQEVSTDSAIVSAIRRVDPAAFVIDPLRNHWRFPRDDGGTGLHPSSRGHLVIAERVARALVRDGVIPSARSRPQRATVTCTSLVQAAERSR